MRHISVLAKEIYESLPEKLNLYMDGTFGHGGHVQYILEKLKTDKPEIFANIKVVGLDLDDTVRQKGKEFIGDLIDKVTLLKNSYSDLDEISEQINNQKIDFMLLDLGVNMEHFKDGSRGFSINSDSPLDMRFDQTQKFSAYDLINGYSQNQLQEMLMKYGDFNLKSAEYIAKGIIDCRQKNSIKTTSELVELLRNLHMNQKKIAVIFQTIRIQTNNELGKLEIFLEKFGDFLNKDGICSIITYHSIEDRIVKIAFKALDESGKFKLINKKVIKPHYQETLRNKASRSAKLRIISKL